MDEHLTQRTRQQDMVREKMSQLGVLSDQFKTAKRGDWERLQKQANALLDDLETILETDQRHQLSTRLLNLNILLFSKGTEKGADRLRRFLYPVRQIR